MRGDDAQLDQLLSQNAELVNEEIKEVGIAAHVESLHGSVISDRSHGSAISKGIRMPEARTDDSVIAIEDQQNMDEPLLSHRSSGLRTQPPLPTGEAMSLLMLAVEFAAWSCINILIEAGAVDSANTKVCVLFLSLDAVYLRVMVSTNRQLQDSKIA